MRNQDLDESEIRGLRLQGIFFVLCAAPETRVGCQRAGLGGTPFAVEGAQVLLNKMKPILVIQRRDTVPQGHCVINSCLRPAKHWEGGLLWAFPDVSWFQWNYHLG